MEGGLRTYPQGRGSGLEEGTFALWAEGGAAASPGSQAKELSNQKAWGTHFTGAKILLFQAGSREA